MGQCAQQVGVKGLVGGDVGTFHAQQVFDGSGDVVTFAHLGCVGHCALERLLAGLGMLVQTDANIGDEPGAKLGAVQHGAIAGDDAMSFQILHPAQTCRWGQTDALCQCDIADPPITAKFTQYSLTYVVQIRHLLRNYHAHPHICNFFKSMLDHLLRMTFDLIPALAAFALVSSITPGPNNLMLMASGANFGFARTMPHMLGIGVGFMVMVLLVGAGLAQVFDAYPISHKVLKSVSVLYLLYLALRIATAAPARTGESKGMPMTFVQAAAFQWVNPKAWSMALTAVTVYTPDTTLAAITLVALVFGAINLPSVSTWTLLGQQMARVLTNPTRLAMFNWTMAALLIASLYPVVFA